MTTAREQAREAARADLENVLRYGGATGPEHAADAASDVWEPLCRDLYKMLRDSTPGPLQEDWPVTALLRRAKEALDDHRS